MTAKKQDDDKAGALEGEAKEGSQRLKLSVAKMRKTVRSGVKGGLSLLPTPWIEA